MYSCIGASIDTCAAAVHNQTMKIVVSGLIGSYPLGGVGRNYLAYVSGFRRLGHEIFRLPRPLR
jgi:hypothetical protein